MAVFIGIDGGGTKTEAILINENGQILGKVRGEATNPASGGGHQAVLDRLKELVDPLIQKANLENKESIYLFAGISGMGAPAYRRMGLDYFRENYPDAMIDWDHDGVNALYSGTFGAPGGVLIAGTGSIAFGIDVNGERIRIGGWGHWVGDEGSGFALGRLALKRIMEAWDGRGLQTTLTEKVLRFWNMESPEDIIRFIHGGDGKQSIASIAPLVFAAAEEKDAVAMEVMKAIGIEQGELVRALVNRLAITYKNHTIPIVLTGGLFHNPGYFLPMIQQVVAQSNKQVKFILPASPPVIGALVAALKLAQITPEKIKGIIRRLDNTAGKEVNL